MKSITKNITIAAVIGAAYAAATMLLSPISYGPIQCRISEVLCILPFFFPGASYGLYAGCLLSNLMSAAGLPDVIFGSLATLLAAMCTARLGRSFRETGIVPKMSTTVLACSMPVLFNMPIIGAILSITYTPANFVQGFIVCGLQVGAGEALVMFCLALPLARYLHKSQLMGKYITSI